MFEGYWSKDGAWTPDVNKPIYNDSTLDAMRREEQRRQESYDRYKSSRERYEKAQREAREKRERERAWEEMKRQREADERREAREADMLKEIERKERRVDSWLHRNLFRKLVNKVNGKSKKFKNYQGSIKKSENIFTKQSIAENMVNNLGSKKMREELKEEKGRSR